MKNGIRHLMADGKEKKIRIEKSTAFVTIIIISSFTSEVAIVRR